MSSRFRTNTAAAVCESAFGVLETEVTWTFIKSSIFIVVRSSPGVCAREGWGGGMKEIRSDPKSARHRARNDADRGQLFMRSPQEKGSKMASKRVFGRESKPCFYK